MGKLVCEQHINGQDVLRSITTAAGINVGQFVKTIPGLGKPFWWWPSIPPGTVVGADFTGAPVVAEDAATNNASIAAISATPQSVLIYDPPLP